MRIYTVKENPIGSAVTEILWYRHTNRQTYILLLFYKDYILVMDTLKQRKQSIAQVQPITKQVSIYQYLTSYQCLSNPFMKVCNCLYIGI